MNHLNNILTRIENAAAIINLDDWLLEKLSGFKLRWSSDIEARMDDGSLKQFRAVRIWHRSPHTDKPHKGGLRYHPDVNEDVMLAHAIEMSIKCWIMGLEWGGAKGGVAVDPLKHSNQELKNITEALVDEMNERSILGPFRDVPAPDVGTGPRTMNWIRQRYAQKRREREDARFAAVVTGKPVGYGFDGIPGRVEATGCGLVTVLGVLGETMMKFSDSRCLFPNFKIAVMGFGNVGLHVAKFAYEKGFKVIAVSDVDGGIYNKNGLDIPGLLQYFAETKSIKGVPNSESITNQELLELNDCDILVPAALENVITKENAHRIKAKIVLEGANGPTTPEADQILQDNGVTIIPDILANAGGVTVSFFEWARNVNIGDERVPVPNKEAVLKAMQDMLIASTKQVMDTAEKHHTSLRNAAYIVAIEKVAPLFREKHLA